MVTEFRTDPARAAILMVAAMALIGVIDNLIALVAEHIGLWQFHMMRAALAIPLIIVLSVLGLGKLAPNSLWRVAVRSILLGVSMLCYFGALGIMPIAQALAGLFTSPIFILLISALAMGRRIGIWRISAAVLGFSGTLIVLQPDLQSFDGAILLPVAGGFFYALSAIATRSLCEGESTLTLLLGTMVTLGIFGAIGSALLWAFVPPDNSADFLTRGWVSNVGPVMWMIAAQAVFSVAGVFLIIRAYQIGEASYVAVFEYSVMIFGPLFAWLAFGQTLGPVQMIGIVMIAIAGAIIALRSRSDSVAA